MCDICFCISWPEKSQHASSHIDRCDSSVDVRYLFCISWLEKSQHASSHIDRCDSPVDVRYLLLYLLARKITTTHHRTSTDAIRQFMPRVAKSIFHQSVASRVVFEYDPPFYASQTMIWKTKQWVGPRIVASKKLRDFTPTCKLPLRVW